MFALVVDTPRLQPTHAKALKFQRPITLSNGKMRNFWSLKIQISSSFIFRDFLEFSSSQFEIGRKLLSNSSQFSNFVLLIQLHRECFISTVMMNSSQNKSGENSFVFALAVVEIKHH